MNFKETLQTEVHAHKEEVQNFSTLEDALNNIPQDSKIYNSSIDPVNFKLINLFYDVSGYWKQFGFLNNATFDSFKELVSKYISINEVIVEDSDDDSSINEN